MHNSAGTFFRCSAGHQGERPLRDERGIVNINWNLEQKNCQEEGVWVSQRAPGGAVVGHSVAPPRTIVPCRAKYAMMARQNATFTAIERPFDGAVDGCTGLFIYVAVLRHPLRLMRSAALNSEFSITEVLDHLRRRDSGPLGHRGCLPKTSGYQQFDNFATRDLLGYRVFWLPPGGITRAHLASAKEVVAGLDLALILEDLSDECMRIESVLRWDTVVMDGRTKSHTRESEFTESQAAALRRHNWADIELYEFARNMSISRRAQLSSQRKEASIIAQADGTTGHTLVKASSLEGDGNSSILQWTRAPSPHVVLQDRAGRLALVTLGLFALAFAMVAWHLGRLCGLLGLAGPPAAQEALDSAGGAFGGTKLLTEWSRIDQGVLVASLGHFCMGFNFGIIGGAMQNIEQEGRFPPMHSQARGLVVTCLLVGSAVGVVGSIVADSVGRRRTLLAMAATYVLGPAIMATATRMEVLCLGRFVAGLSVGVASSVVNVYISEIALANDRGMSGACAPLLGTTGIMVSNLVSYALSGLPASWRWQLGLGAAPALLMLSLQGRLPETPRWLLSQGNRAEAALSLQALLPEASSEACSGELDSMAHAESTTPTRQAHIYELFTVHRAATLVGVAVNVLQQASGINIVVFFGPRVLLAAGFGEGTSLLALAFMTACQLAATAVLAMLVDRVGRRPMAIFGSELMIVGLLLLVTGYLARAGGGHWAVTAVFAGMLTYRVAFSLSLGPLPYIIPSELFPQDARAAGVSVCQFSNLASNILITQAFSVVDGGLSRRVGADVSGAVVFTACLVPCMLAFAFSHYFLPETRGCELGKVGEC